MGEVPGLAERFWRGMAADPGNSSLREVRAGIYQARAEQAKALMTRGIFSEAARESAAKAGRPFPERGSGQRPTWQEEKR